jgi:DNA-binding transcriptional LysR family regulator
MKPANLLRPGAEAWDGRFSAREAKPFPATVNQRQPVHDGASTAEIAEESRNGRGQLKVISRRPGKRRAGTNIDLKLLAIISELHRTRSVSHAAENLDLSQSTISMSLAKLRRHCNDRLFVRTSTGMEPTPHAKEVLTLLSKAEGLIQSALEHHISFDPATSDRVFHISSTEIAQVILLPALMKRLRKVAPRMQVSLLHISESIALRLESGDVDLAVGYIAPLGAGFYQQRLFRDRLVCAARVGHPRVKSKLTLESFEQEEHVAVATPETGHDTVGRTVAAKKIRRKVGLRVPGFLGLGPILTSTDYLAIVPEKLGRYFASAGNIRLLPLPFSIAPLFILQHWHERYNDDPANVWFRGRMAELFLE